MNNNTVIILIGVVLLIIVGALVLTNQNAVNTGSSVLNPTPGAVQGVTAPNVKNFTVTAAEYSFSPNTIQVNQGDTVHIVLNNNGTMPHSLSIDEFNARTKIISPAQSDSVEFTANKAGTYQFYCSIDGHRQMGMIGNLIVR